MSEVTFATPTNASTNATAGRTTLFISTPVQPKLIRPGRCSVANAPATSPARLTKLTPATRLAAAGKQLSPACVPGPLTSKAFTWLVMQVQNSLKRHFWPAKECILNLNTPTKAILPVGTL